LNPNLNLAAFSSSNRLVLALAGLFFAAVPTPHRITNAVADVARPLPLTAVRLTGGPLKHAQDLDAQYLLTLDPNRMLAYYRQRAGLTPKAEPYGGWDGDGRNLTGHIAGHYLSAVSLMWAATGDARFKERADTIVKELKEVQDKNGDGYLSALAKGRETFEDVAKGNIRSAGFDLNGLWSPWYTLHKTFAGLRDAWRYTDNRTALDVEVKYAGWAESIVSKLDDAQMQKMLNTEFGGMPEVLADLYADTGDKRWLALSRRFEHRAALDPLKHHEDRLSGLHGNTIIPKLVGSASRYAYTGDLDDALAATFFWDRVVHHHTFATGGHGKDEYFRDPDRLGEIVDGRTAETCNVYNMLKLTRRLFALRPNVDYAEFHERALFNHILGSIDPADGSTCYMVPVGRSRGREYAQMQRSFTCCVGSGMESHALHGLGIYYESGDRLWVNLYAPSTAEWKSAGVTLRMETDFPEGEAASLKLAVKTPRKFTLALRRPGWAGQGFAVKVNGQVFEPLSTPPGYVELDRIWHDGDAVELVLPKTLHLEPTPDNPRRAAILWGPLVLAGDLGAQPERGDRGEGGGRAPLPEAPAIVAADRALLDWLKPVADKPGEFRTEGVGRDRDVSLVPFYRLHRHAYSAYWDLFTPAEWEKKAADLAREREKLKKLEAATVAFLQPGEMQPERDFNQQGESTTVIGSNVLGRPGRRATKWFSYDMPVEAARPLALVVTYHSDQRRARTFEVSVDGQRLGEETIPQGSTARFFDVEYPIPSTVVQGKQKVTVRFQAGSDSEIPGVFGLRIIRADAER
jgi:uncharacterized protein